MAGAAIYVGDGLYLSRPVYDSYGVVKIDPPLAGVHVYKSNALIGVTDASGSVFIPDLGSYQVNSVEIRTKDLPLDYSLPSAHMDLRPPLRGGGVADFHVTRVRAVTGKLVAREAGGLKPLDDYEFLLSGKTPGVQIRTVRGGGFYLENLEPGRYTAELKLGEKMCKLEMTVPETSDIIADLGDVICETID